MGYKSIIADKAATAAAFSGKQEAERLGIDCLIDVKVKIYDDVYDHNTGYIKSHRSSSTKIDRIISATRSAFCDYLGSINRAGSITINIYQ